jgi:hypothetical protein
MASDHQAGVGQIGQLLDRNQAFASGFGVCCGQLAFGGHFFELRTDAGDCLGGGTGAVVEQFDGVAGCCRHLGDAGTHGAGADHGDNGLCGKSAHGLFTGELGRAFFA